MTICGTGFDPYTLFDHVFDAAINVVDSDGAVDSWSTVAGLHAHTATTTRPTLISEDAAAKGQPGISFDATDDVLTGPASFASLFNGNDVPHSIWLVFRRSGGGGSDFIWTVADSGNTESVRLTTSAGPELNYQRSATGQGLQSAVSNTYPNNVTDLYGIDFGGQTAQIYQRTTDITADNTVDANALTNLTVSKIGGNTSGGQNLGGVIYFMGFRFDPLSAGQQLALSQYSRNRWRIPKP